MTEKTRERILVVEDEEDIRELIRYNLAKAGYEVECVESGEAAVSELARRCPDLLVLDLMLPGMDGLTVCRRVREQHATATLPIVMLTARAEESDVVIGLELGADDYLTKPFSPRVLIARIRAVLRRRTAPGRDEEQSIVLPNLTIHPGRHQVLVDGKPITLSATEFKLLHYLAGRPGWVFTRDQLIDAVHGQDYPVTDRSVDVHVVALRKKLGDAGDYIETVRGIGYRFKDGM